MLRLSGRRRARCRWQPADLSSIVKALEKAAGRLDNRVLLEDNVRGEYVELWFVSAALFLTWFVLTVFLHKSGMVHVLLLSGIAVFVVQFAAFRKARHHKNMARR